MFQRAMAMILADVKRHLCLVYLDDAIVFSRSEGECGATAPRHPPGRGRAHRIAVAEVTAGPIPQRSLYSRVIPTARTKDSGGDRLAFFPGRWGRAPLFPLINPRAHPMSPCRLHRTSPRTPSGALWPLHSEREKESGNTAHEKHTSIQVPERPIGITRWR